AMVGSLGSDATAAVGIVLPLMWLVNGLCAAISTGFSVMVAHAIGAENMAKASSATSKSIFASALLGGGIGMLGLLFYRQMPLWMGAKPETAGLASSYFAIMCLSTLFNMASVTCSAILRSCGKTKTPLIVNTMAIAFNFIFNFLLIFSPRHVTIFGREHFIWGAGLGVAGAALGTMLAIAISFFLLLYALCRNDRGIFITRHDMFTFDKEIYMGACSVGIPIALERMTISLGQIAYMRIISGMGTMYVAAHHLANQAESLSYLPCFGFSAAATTLVGQAMGAKDYESAERFGSIAAKIGIFMSLLASAVLFFGGRGIISVFSTDPVIINMGANLLKIVALGQQFQAASIIYAGGIRGTGESRAPFYIGLTGIWGIRIVLCIIFVFVFKMKLYAAWVAMLIDMAYRGYATYVCYKRRFKKLMA
ncbi:MAG: MATE family efflux transporter, partial [Oscillospiraceae bacterium]